MAVDQLTGARAAWQREQIGLKGLVDGFEMATNERRVGSWQRIAVEFDLGGKE
jgi:hypothetical protein